MGRLNLFAWQNASCSAAADVRTGRTSSTVGDWRPFRLGRIKSTGITKPPVPSISLYFFVLGDVRRAGLRPFIITVLYSSELASDIDRFDDFEVNDDNATS
jgi:hypothetical protein